MKTINNISIILLLIPLTAMTAPTRTSGLPNILFIVADDMGYGDCGVNGCRDIPTPNLDALAASGVRFTDGYVTGTVCSPSRASLMTGCYQQRVGVPDWVRPDASKGLNPDVPTIANYLQNAGYRTALVGKWHLGESAECNPLNRGFDEFFGFLGGGRSYWPDKLGKHQFGDRNYRQMWRGHEPIVETEYLTHAFCREALEFISRQQEKKQPFFLYLAFNAVHDPLEAPDNYLQRFTAIKDKRRRIYAAMLSAMDDDIGRVLKAVQVAGIDGNTLICFISDNGGPISRCAPNGSRNTPFRGGKGETWEGGIHVPFFMTWSGHLKPDSTFSHPVIQMDLTATALAVAGVKANINWPMDGVNLMPFLTGGNPSPPHSTLYWGYGEQFAIREGDWKLTCALPPKQKQKKDPILGLYDLSKDMGENDGQPITQIERFNGLMAAWTNWHNKIWGGHPIPEVQIGSEVR